jgi:hypothetical protein
MRNFDPPPPEVEEDYYIRNLVIVLCTVVPFGILLLVSVIVRFVCFMKKRKRLKQVEVEKKKKLES